MEHFTRILFEGHAAEFSNPKLLGDNLTQVQDRIQTIVPGVARGRMLGGNLTVLPRRTLLLLPHTVKPLRVTPAEPGVYL